MSDQRTQLSFGEYAAIVWRRRRLVLLMAALFASVTFVVFNFVPRRYTTQAIFERRGDSVSVRTDRNIPENFNNLKPMLRFEMTGKLAVQKALEQLGYTRDLQKDAAGLYTPQSSQRLDALIARVQAGLNPVWVVNTDTVDQVSLTFTCDDPVLAQKLPNQLLTNYIANTRTQLLGQLTGSCAFLSDQVAASREKLSKLREERFAFALAHPDMLVENPEPFADHLTQVEDSLERLRQQQKALESQLAALKALDGAHDSQSAGQPVRTPNPQYAAIQSKVEELRKELDTALNVEGKTDKHPQVIKLTAVLRAAEQELSQTPAETLTAGPTLTRPADPAILMEINRLGGELDGVNQELARSQQLHDRYDKAQADLVPVTKEYQRLSTLMGDAEGEVNVWQRNLAEVQMALDAERNNTRNHLSIAKLAEPVYRPTWPPLWLVFGLALGGGVTFGVMLVVLLERARRGFGGAEQLRRSVELPVLGVVGPILSPAARRAQALRRFALAPALATLLLIINVVAATGVVLSVQYPSRYVQILEQLGPAARTLWQSTQSLLGLIS